MQPIQTEWRGYNFRSRLEARYAVLFEDAGIEWRYELQGFELHDGRRYLPDFYLPGLNVYVEVKGVDPSHEDKRLLRDFQAPLFLVVDLPDFDSMMPIGLDGTLYIFSIDHGGGMPFISDAQIIRCRKCDRWVIEVDPESDKLHRGNCKLVDQSNEYKKWGPHCKHGFDYEFLHRGLHQIETATKTAKSARFEHGEDPLEGD